MARRTDPGQFDLFADEFAATGTTSAPQERPRVSGFGGTPDLVPQVLADIFDGRVAVLMPPSGRVVRLDGDGHCRYTDDDVTSVVESLMRQRYAVVGEVTTLLHGAIRKTAERVMLSPAGDKIRRRWFHLAGVR